MAKVKKMAFGGMSAKAADAALKAAQRDMDARKNAAAQQRNEEIARTTGYIGVKPPPEIAAIQDRMKADAMKKAAAAQAAAAPAKQFLSDQFRGASKPAVGFGGLGAKIDAAKARAEAGTPSKSSGMPNFAKPYAAPMGGGAGFGNPADPAKFAAVKSAMTGRPSPAKPAGLGAAMSGPKTGLGTAMGMSKMAGAGAALGKKLGMKSGGSVSSASKRADGIATKGKTKGRMC